MPLSDSESLGDRTAERYARYYARQGSDRNSLLENPEVMFQWLANVAAIIRALRASAIDPSRAKVLDIGCGTGNSLLPFLDVDFPSEALSGIDLLEDRIALARTRFPGIDFHLGDARSLPFDDVSFDVVSESGLFVTLTDDSVAGQIAREMVRVVRPGGHLLLADWRYAAPWRSQHKGLSRRRTSRLFGVGEKTEVVQRHLGSLVPPIGRRLSRYCGCLYFLVCRIFPFLAGFTVTLLRRIDRPEDAEVRGDSPTC